MARQPVNDQLLREMFSPARAVLRDLSDDDFLALARDILKRALVEVETANPLEPDFRRLG